MAPRSCHRAFLDTHRPLRAQGEPQPCEHQLLADSSVLAQELLGGTHRDFLSPQARPQSFYCTKTPHTVLDGPGGQAPASAGTLGCSIRVCSPPKINEKSLGMLQARSLCFRLFSTKRLGNKAHSFPSRESERVNVRKQILKT